MNTKKGNKKKKWWNEINEIVIKVKLKMECHSWNGTKWNWKRKWSEQTKWTKTKRIKRKKVKRTNKVINNCNGTAQNSTKPSGHSFICKMELNSFRNEMMEWNEQQTQDCVSSFWLTTLSLCLWVNKPNW